MPAPTWIGKLNKVGLNRITRRFAGRIPPFALVIHRGRTSGHEFRTPIMAFPRGSSFTIALTYGPKTDWVKNVMAAGSFQLVYKGREIALTNPRLVEAEAGLPTLPALLRPIVKLLRVRDFLLANSAAAQHGQE